MLPKSLEGTNARSEKKQHCKEVVRDKESRKERQREQVQSQKPRSQSSAKYVQ